jgi:hypothetical protein
MEDVVHHRLEGGRAVRQTKEHDKGFEKTSIGAESGLPLVAFVNPNVVETPTYVQLGEIPSPLEVIY